MLESGIGRAGNVALASLPNFTLPGDISASRRYYKQDIVEPEFVVDRDSMMAVPTGPGIGVEVQMDRLERVTVRKQEFRA
jgi:O-succinylbenzoate synthase